MAREYAVIKNGKIISRSAMFDENSIADRIVLEEGYEIWTSGSDPFEAEREELISRLIKAEEENQTKEVFLSNMSHDIRTPMNAIIGMTAIAKKYIDEKYRVQDSLDKIEVASSHLLSLINEVLDISRINSGTMVITNDLFSLSDLMHEVLIIVRPQADSKGHNFAFHIGEIDYENLYGDILHLRQIFVNIINNSVKYTNDNGQIDVWFAVRPAGEKAVLEFVCRDNGIGMSEEFLKKIFVPFTRASSTTISRVEGTGLGMSIVARLVENMDGTIDITSKEGEGTEVTIRIPLFYENTAVDTTAVKDKKILIVEGDEAAHGVFDMYLDEFGIRHQTVSDSSEAIEQLTEAEFKGEPFDMVIIGRKWSGAGDVFEFAGYIRQRSNNIAIVLANEMDWSEIEYRATRAGISGFIPVPFLRKALLNGLNAVLASGASEDVQSSTPDLTGRNILLVEDNMINRIIANELLNGTNAHVENAENGKEAVDKYLASPEGYYQVILMDIQMPVMDGYEASRQIRHSGRKDASTVRIIAMTANIFAQDIARAREAGMDGHVAKPIDVTKLMQALRQV